MRVKKMIFDFLETHKYDLPKIVYIFKIATPSGVPSGGRRLDEGLRTGLGIGYLAIG